MSSAAPEYAFATPFLNPPASPIRSLMPYAMRPGTISLAGGYPAQELFDVDGLSIASSQVMARLGTCLQYSNIDGQASLRHELARLSAARGLVCNADTELAASRTEIAALVNTNPEVWARAADALDPRLQKVSLTSEARIS